MKIKEKIETLKMCRTGILLSIVRLPPPYVRPEWTSSPTQANIGSESKQTMITEMPVAHVFSVPIFSTERTLFFYHFF